MWLKKDKLNRLILSRIIKEKKRKGSKICRERNTYTRRKTYTRNKKKNKSRRTEMKNFECNSLKMLNKC
jgi:hypothetical protein